MQSNKHIFLSYSRIDSAFALRLVRDLKKNGLKVWVDQFDIPNGKHWDNIIEEALDNSCAMILIISSVSVRSERVKDEVSYAQDNNIHIFPVRYEDVKVPLSWRRLQSVEINDKNYHQKIGDFIQRIANLVRCEISDISITPKKSKKTFLKWLVLCCLVLIGVYYLFLNQVKISHDQSFDEKVVGKIAVPEINKTDLLINIEPKVEKKLIKEQKIVVKPKPEIVKKSPEKNQKKRKKPVNDKTEKVTTRVSETDNIKSETSLIIYQKLKERKTPSILKPLSLNDPYADIVNRYIQELQKDNNTKLVIVSHTNRNNEYDTAQKKAYAVSLDLRARGLKRSMIAIKIKADGRDKVTYDFKREIK